MQLFQPEIATSPSQENHEKTTTTHCVSCFARLAFRLCFCFGWDNTHWDNIAASTANSDK
jgi:hypothetical protein